MAFEFSIIIGGDYFERRDIDVIILQIDPMKIFRDEYKEERSWFDWKLFSTLHRLTAACIVFFCINNIFL